MNEIKEIVHFNQYIEDLLAKTECSDLEYKSAKGGFPGSFWETYSAFANTDGGTIILGVAEKKNRFYLDGLSEDQIEKYLRDFWNNVNNKGKVSCNLMKTEDVIKEDYKGNKILLFFVPRASREQRPVFLTTQPYNGTFKRDYEGDYKCTEKEVQRMFADADTSRPVDSRILKNYSMDDIDKNSLSQYRQLFAIAKPDHPWLAEGDLEFLRKLGGYRKDRTTGEEGFTLAGLLMFGKSEAITDIDCCPNFFPDYQEILSDNPNIRWTNRVCPDGTWEANLFQYYRTVLPRLQAILPKPFRLESNIRIDDTPSHVAIREALINLCIHADYSENATLTVKLYKTKIELSNPGTLLVSTKQYYEGGDSVCRNKALQNMFMMLGTAEKAGSGVDKILKGWREANWRAPIVSTKVRPDKVELTMKMESLMDAEVQEKLVELFGERILGIGHDKLLVLEMASADGSVTNESLRYVLNIHKSEISELLKAMCYSKLLVPEGYGRGTKYRLSLNSDNEDPNGNVASNGTNVASNGTNIASNGTNVASNGTNVASNGTNIASNKPAKTKKRFTPQEMHDAICEYASDWISLEDLSVNLDRDKSYLRNIVIPNMIREGYLEMLFPAVHKHRGQKYKIKEHHK